MIGLICSVRFESEELVGRLARRRVYSQGGVIIVRGILMSNPVAVVVSGVGKTNASHGATLLHERFRPEIVINFGVGGAYPGSGLAISDIAVAEREIYGDEGVLTEKGFRGMRYMGIPLLKKSGVRSQESKGNKSGGRGQTDSKTNGKDVRDVYNVISLDKKLVKKVSGILKKRAFNFKVGSFVTLSTVTGTNERAEELKRRYHPVCENMEGAAAAHICRIYGIPFLDVRGISNVVEKRDKRRWDLRGAATACQRAVVDIVREWYNI
jgi:futalosine hydrolase